VLTPPPDGLYEAGEEDVDVSSLKWFWARNKLDNHKNASGLLEWKAIGLLWIRSDIHR
jgi:hypothetical protein